MIELELDGLIRFGQALIFMIVSLVLALVITTMAQIRARRTKKND